MAAKDPKWFTKEKPSTFTHLARNDRSVDWVLRLRDKHKMPPVKKVCVIGSGVVEPFTLAALPGLSSAQIVAIDVNPELIDLGNQIKEGKATPWPLIAKSSHNPGEENTDFLDPKRLNSGLVRLHALGSLNNLGSNFNSETIQVPSGVAGRVSFIKGDALQVMKKQKGFDLVVEGFVRVNLLKNPDLGTASTRELTTITLHSLSENGMYLIGDTGESLPDTFGCFVKTLPGVIHCASLAHVVQIGLNRFTTSHYTLASLMEDLNTQDLQDQAKAHLSSHHKVYSKHTIQISSLSQVHKELVSGFVNLAYAKTSTKQGLTVNIPMRGLTSLALTREGEFSPPADSEGNGIIFPPQK